MDREFKWLGETLRDRALHAPDDTAFIFLEDHGKKTTNLTYKELDRQARSVAAELLVRDLGGKRILLLFVPGLDFIVALYACFYAGAVAVPAYPPEPSRLDRTLPRLEAIVADATPAAALTTRALLDVAQLMFAGSPTLGGTEWLASDDIAWSGCEDSWVTPAMEPHDLALLQYTSGSTSIPKGVMLSHANIISNMRMIQRAASQDSRRVISSWAPFYHDLGLMGGIVLPVLMGGSAVLMSPLEFLQRPLTWLASITKYRATDTFVPNFALDVCSRKITTEERRSLDLSSLEMCVVAAEPVRHSTVERFIRTFERCGFARRCVIPGYGLAESTVAVTGGPLGEIVKAEFVNPRELVNNRWVELDPRDENARPIVGCGKPFEGVHVEIVNPSTCERCGPGEIGEVWVNSPSVARGYWQRDAETAETFGARIKGDEARSYLRTGDLGYVKEEQLFITGRIKDLLVIWGKNHYPQDIELTVEMCSARVRPGCAIAFSVEQDGIERVVIVAEVDTRGLKHDEDRAEAFAEVIREIRMAVNSEHMLQVFGVTLIKARTIDKTSSGKVARSACRKRYLDGSLEVESAWTMQGSAPGFAGPVSVAPAPREAPVSLRPQFIDVLRAAPTPDRVRLLTDYLGQELQRVIGRGAERISFSDASFNEFGLDSLAALELAGRVERDLSVKLSVVKLIDMASMRAMVDYLLDSMALEEELAAPMSVRRGAGAMQADQPPPSIRLAPSTPYSAHPSAGQWHPPRLPSVTSVPEEAPPPSGSPPSVDPLAGDGPISLRSAALSRALLSSRPAAPKLVHVLQPVLSKRPFFAVGGVPGNAIYLLALSRAVGRDQPFCGFQTPGLDGAERPLRTVEDLARRFIEEMVAVQPHGPYVLGGHSFGGLVAYEMAQQLVARGDSVSQIVLIDSAIVESGAPETASEIAAMFELLNFFRRLNPEQRKQPLAFSEIAGLSQAEQRMYLWECLTTQEGIPAGYNLQNLVDVYAANYEAMERYKPAPCQLPVTLLRAVEGLPQGTMYAARKTRLCFEDPNLGWGALCPTLRVLPVPGDHFNMVIPPYVSELGRTLKTVLADADPVEIDLDASTLKHARRTAARPVEQSRRGGVLFNPFHPEFIASPYPFLAQLRAQDPVHWSSMSIWCVSKYSDVAAGLKDKRFSVDSRNASGGDASRSGSLQVESSRHSILGSWLRNQTDSPLAQLYNNMMMFLDPPRHTRLRKLVAKSFEPAVLRQWRPYVEEATSTLISEMRLRREPDIMRDIAVPLPSTVIATLIGIPREDAGFLRKWTNDMFQGFDIMILDDVYRRASRSAADFSAYIREHVRKRQGKSKDDLLGVLESEVDGDRLSMEELVANCIMLFTAGIETTTNMIGNGVLTLLTKPDQLELLRARPDLTESAVEEILRFEPAVRHDLRTALEDVEMGGKVIRRGDMVLFLLSSANRDPDAFPDPDKFDITRSARHHVAFGHGIHYCVGAPLARLEIQIAIRAIVDTLPGLRLAAEGAEWRRSISMRALERLRVSFDS